MTKPCRCFLYCVLQGRSASAPHHKYYFLIGSNALLVRLMVVSSITPRGAHNIDTKNPEVCATRQQGLPMRSQILVLLMASTMLTGTAQAAELVLKRAGLGP